MQINITHQNFELTESIKDYAKQKLGAVEKYIKSAEEATLNVEIGKISLHHKHGNHYEVKVHLRMGSRNIHIENVNEDVYHSIDEAKDKISNEIANGGDRERSMLKKIARRFKNIIKGDN